MWQFLLNYLMVGVVFSLIIEVCSKDADKYNTTKTGRIVVLTLAWPIFMTLSILVIALSVVFGIAVYIMNFIRKEK